MKGKLEAAITLIFGSEGGYSNNPADPGGPTKYGITQSTLTHWRGTKVAEADVRALTLPEAAEIIRAQYAFHVHFDELPAGLDYAMLDYAVNSGPAQANKTLQRVLGVAQDGIMGAKTLDASQRQPDSVLVRNLCDARMTFLRGLRNWKTFGDGWTNRVQHVQEVALGMCDNPDVIALISPTYHAGGDAKAPPAETTVLSTIQGKAHLGTIVSSTVATAGLATAKLSPFAGHIPHLDQALTWVGFGGAVAAILAGAFGLESTNKRIGTGVPQ